MSGDDLRQRLAAILAADAVGYSRLMSLDERATVAVLDAARAVFHSKTTANQGRVVDTAGDSVLAVFETAAGALNAALQVQAALAEAGKDIPMERRMLFRIGIHLGDVMEKADGSVYGDGVNIAARLQALAEPGQITVSDAIHGAVRGKVSATFADQGNQTVKNIAHPVRAYRVQVGDKAESVSAAAAKPGAGEIDLSLPDKPSISVLPFTNMSGDPEQEYFTDGVTEDIITELSRFHSLFVIARNSSFTYKGKAVDVRTVSRELGVRYVLEGSIRRAANRIRVTAQLIDAITGNHIWAEKYDRVLEDIFALQEEVTQSVVTAIVPQIDQAEIARPVRPGNLRAYELAMRGWAALRSDGANTDRSLRAKAIDHARAALDLDPNSNAALRVLALACARDINYNTAPAIEDARRIGLEAAERAIALDNADHLAHLCKGLVLLNSGEPEAALKLTRRAYELNPNDTLTLGYLGYQEIALDNYFEGREFARKALRSSPNDPLRHLFLWVISWAYCGTREYALAIEWAQRALDEAPNSLAAKLCLTVSLVGAGEVERANAEFRVVRKLAPEAVEARISGGWTTVGPRLRARATTFLRIAAGLEDPSAADALR